MARPSPGPGEVRVRLSFSGVNPSDVKTRSGRTADAIMAFPRMVPHSDGSGVIDAVGVGVSASANVFGFGTDKCSGLSAPLRNTLRFPRSTPSHCLSVSASRQAPIWAFRH
ncbi:alcohol dehydrogenase catalytic domain-containing protein [Variovorax sp. ZT4R33]|uniref:alcohol dehydrogenase catalytic domain-containing protein n=1 Tax=Variovorax sp. ZT4R33 TaxID=3443743 RepID=UPI003F47F361